MPYTNEIYRKAEQILEKRRNDSLIEAEIRRNKIRNEIPEIDEIQTQLSKIGLEISKIFFYKGDTDKKVKELRAKSESLVEKRELILKQNGYKMNAMSEEHICSECEDRGFINGRMCACHKQLLKDVMRKEVSRFTRLDDFTFDNFNLEYYNNEPLENSIVPRNKAQRVFDVSRLYAQQFNSNSKNLLFLGKTGLGKTHLSLAIANVVINKGYSVCYGSSQNICDDLQSEQFGRYDNLSYTKKQVLDCDLLIIDDLGTEISNQYSVATIYTIINSRILSHKPTIISTNYEFEELLEKYDQRITSRINGEYTKFYLFGDDIRNKK